MLYLLIALLFLIILIFLINKRDVFSPSFLLATGYFVSTFFAYLNREKWYSSISLKTFFVILTAILVFFVIELLIKRVLVQNKGICTVKPFYVPEIGFTKFVFVLLIDIVSFAFIMREIIMISGSSGTLSMIISSYKQEHLSTGIDFSFLGSTLVKVVSSLSFVFLYLFISHLVNKNLKFHYLIPAAFGLLTSLLMSNRLILLSYLFFSIVCFSLVKQKCTGLRMRIRLKSVLIFTGLIALSLFVFYKVSDVIGRNSGNGFFDYISVYAGSSIVGLNTYLSEGVVTHNYYFYEILPGFINSLSKLGFTESVTKILDFRSISPTIYLYSNVYSGLRRMFNSGGIIGVIAFQTIFSFIICWLYYSIKYKNYSYFKYGLITILFGKIVYCVPLQAVEDHFFIDVISLGYLIDILITIALFHFIASPSFNNNLKKITISISPNSASRNRRIF